MELEKVTKINFRKIVSILVTGKFLSPSSSPPSSSLSSFFLLSLFSSFCSPYPTEPYSCYLRKFFITKVLSESPVFLFLSPYVSKKKTPVSSVSFTHNYRKIYCKHIFSVYINECKFQLSSSAPLRPTWKQVFTYDFIRNKCISSFPFPALGSLCKAIRQNTSFAKMVWLLSC